MILDSILAQVQRRLEERRQRRPLRAVELAAAAAEPARGFASALLDAPGGMALIGELKKSSPSASTIRAEFDVPRLARQLREGGADALSVLTEVDHFQGSLEFLQRTGDVGLPRLQKDFLTTEYQILEGRAAGADAALLIAEALPGARLADLCQLVLDVGMDVLCEGHDPAQIHRAATLAERDAERIFVGINNRDLRTFAVSLERSFTALAELPRGLHVVSESGIETARDVRRLRDAGARGILVGTMLMRAEDAERAARTLMQEVRPHA